MNYERNKARKFRDLIVWRKAHESVIGVYGYVSSFPKSEVYGLSSQMSRAAVSVPANIAEGFKRRGPADKAKFLNIAAASLEEMRYYLILADDLNYGSTDRLMNILEEVNKLINAYSKIILNSEF